MAHFYVLVGATLASVFLFKAGRKKGRKNPGRYYAISAFCALIAITTVTKLFG